MQREVVGLPSLCKVIAFGKGILTKGLNLVMPPIVIVSYIFEGCNFELSDQFLNYIFYLTRSSMFIKQVRVETLFLLSDRGEIVFSLSFITASA